MRRLRVGEDVERSALLDTDPIVASDSRVPVAGDLVLWPVQGMGARWRPARLVAPSRATPVLTRIERLDEASFREACDLLTGEDEAIAELVDRHGIPPFWGRPPGFRTLALLILEQQVSLESAAACYRRLEDAVGGDLRPDALVALGMEELRALGVSRQKSRYLLGLAGRVARGGLDVEALGACGTGAARAALLELDGVGPWTADAYLLSALRHIDVWPVGDRALRVGVGEMLRTGAVPGEDELERLGRRWRPLRAVVARIVWHAYLEQRGRALPATPALAASDGPAAGAPRGVRRGPIASPSAGDTESPAEGGG